MGWLDEGIEPGWVPAAAAVADVLAQEPVDWRVSSRLARAVPTAAPLAALLSRQPIVDDRFGELRSGTARAIRRTRSPSGGRSIGSDGRSEPHALEVEGRETLADLNARVAGALDELFADLVVVPDHVVHPGLLGGWVVLKPRVQGGHRMRLHANAALSFRQRERMVCRVVEQGWSITKAAEAAEVSERTCSKWVARYRAEGLAGLIDRSSAPGVVANRIDERTVQAIAALRRLRFTGPEIAEILDRPLSTISGILTRIGMAGTARTPARRAL
jgi:leucine-zipper of insertion element IS481/Histidine phosphatase superfamily (branch 1)